MRIFFHPANFGVAQNSARIITKSSLPLRAFDSIQDVETEINATTLNVGNIVHNEAVAKAFNADRRRSCMAPLEHFYISECRSDLAKFQGTMRSCFDAVVLSFANLISAPAPGRRAAQQKHMERLCEILEALPIPFYIFGMGMQSLVDDENELTPGMLEFLKLIDKKAKLFAVRGEHTVAFLHRIGCSNAVALGCPSLYVYPDNMMSVQTPNTAKGASVLTAGYLGLKYLLGFQSERVDFLRDLARDYNTNYVFQNDVYSYHELKAARGFYDDSSGRCSKEILDNYMAVQGVDPMGFQGYWHMRDARSWRLLAEQHDFYFGDRFHGGVVALQVGKPALFMSHDIRVEELTNHVGAPNCSFAELKEKPLEEIVATAFTSGRLEYYKDTYSARAAEFYERCTEAGIKPLHAVKSRATMAVEKPLSEWQSALIDAATVNRAEDNLPISVAAALGILAQPQQNYGVSELLVQALLAEQMYGEASLCVDIILGEIVEGDKLSAEFLFRLTAKYNRAGRYEDALKFADIFYNKLFVRKGRNTQLYCNILFGLKKYEEAEEALNRKLDEPGFESVFAFMLTRSAQGMGKHALTLDRVAAATALDSDDKFKDRLSSIRANAEKNLQKSI